MSKSTIYVHDAAGFREITTEEHEAMREELEKGQEERQAEVDAVAKATLKRDADAALEQFEGARRERWAGRPGMGRSTLADDLRDRRAADSSSRG